MVGISIAALEAAFAQACTFECLVGRHGTSRWLPTLVGRLDEDGYGEMLVQGMRRSNSCSVRTKAPSTGSVNAARPNMNFILWLLSSWALLQPRFMGWLLQMKMIMEVMIPGDAHDVTGDV
jgi:hypothetical protein